jgi:phosphatidate cytidylyltransferase
VTTTASAAGRGLELGRRTATGIVLAIVVFGSIATVPTFTIVVLGITLASLWELAGLSAKKGQALIFPVAAVAVATYIVLAALNLQHAYEKTLLGLTIIASLAFSLAGERQGYFARSAFTVFGVLYIGWLGSYFIALRNLPDVGPAYAAASIFAIAITDIFAMLVGTAIGRTPLTSISPNKTWEGAIGGFAATTAVGASFALVPMLHMPWWHGAIVGAITSFAAQTGDIVESALKRDARVKDAGTILRGHGGILDRFDSYTFGGIAFYAALYLTGHIPR